MLFVIISTSEPASCVSASVYWLQKTNLARDSTVCFQSVLVSVTSEVYFKDGSAETGVVDAALR